MIKKISKTILVIIGLVLLTTISVNVSADQYNFPDIENFTFEIIPKIRGKETQVDISWQTKEEMDVAEIDIIFIIDGEEITEKPFSLDKNNDNCEIALIGVPFDGGYYYRVRFDILSGKVGTCKADFKYQVHGSKEYVHELYFVSGNANVNNLQYSTANIVLVSMLITFGGIVATYAIVLVSERSKSDSENFK